MPKKKIIYSIVFIALALIGFRPLFAASAVQTDHFKIRGFGGDVPEEKLKRIGRDCESSYADLLAFFGVDPYKSSRIEVSVYLKPQRGNIIASVGAAHIDLYADFNDIKTLKHTLTYIVIHKALPSAPRWFREGLAQYLKYGDIRKGDAQSRLPFKDFSFTRLEAKFGTHIGEGDAYYYCWSIASYLMDVYGNEKLKRVFKESGSFSDRFAKAYGVKLKDIEEKAGSIFAKYKPNAQ